MSLASSSFAGQALAFRPAVQRQQRTSITHIVAKESRIGKLPIPVPPKVEVTIDGQLVKVKVGTSRGALPLKLTFANA